ncbi:ATP-dependent DNA helicase [Bacillus thuringiensis]|uniref:ATP-dependent DNA helicase n=1 Tax=Bacillus thuringiensis TaxID=1428 RepID=UPI0005CE9758|nr:ATP-dependent DNA helicase [Bacillus thuringiensis]
MNSKADVILDIFEEKLPKYYDTNVIRASQVQMALDIGEFLESSKRVMIIEAPVGTGKSLGALIPTLVDRKYNIFDKRSVMYATATINLQGQLMESEIPLLHKMGLVNNPILAKGKAHYYCHFRMKNSSREIEKELFSRADQHALEKFFQTSKTGQRSELEGKYGFNIDDVKWKRVELSSKSNCRICQFSMVCPTVIHRRRFKAIENDVVITNHDQLINSFLSAMDKDSIYEPVLKTDMGVVIIDEAHDFMETFIGRLEETFNLSYLKNVEKYIERDNYKWRKAVGRLRTWIKKKKEDNQKSETGRYMLTDYVFSVLKTLQEIINENLFKAKYRRAEILDGLSIIFHKFLQKRKYTSWVSVEDDEFHVIENDYKDVFRQMLGYIKNSNKIIFMSGTLTVNKDFSYIKNQWNIEPGEAVTKVLDSPFDYKNQALIYIPRGLGNPNNDEFIGKALGEIHGLLSLTGGRTLFLNTSKNHMEDIYNGINADLAAAAIPLYKQGESGVEKLTKCFKESEESVLVGSGSFFSGFSITGTSLTSVIINKLPFPAFNDPIVELMSRGIKDEDRFKKVSYPMMVNKLDQAVGRLIRSIEDYGIVTILDERIYTSKGYGRDVQGLLEDQGYIMTRSWKEVESFYITKLGNGAEAEYKQYSRETLNIGNLLSRPNGKLLEKAKKKKHKKLKKTKIYESKKIKKDQKNFLDQICKEANFKIILNGTTELVFKEVCIGLAMEGLPIAELMRDFPYRDVEEQEKLSQYLAFEGTSKTIEEIYKENEVKVTKNRVNKEQRKFLKDLMEREGIAGSIKREVNDAYKIVYDELYSNWKGVTYLREDFPYQDEEEKRELSTYHGGTRKRVYPLCTQLGCSGACSQQEHKQIVDYLIDTYGAEKVEYMGRKGAQRVLIEPIKILDQDEFRPNELLQMT